MNRTEGQFLGELEKEIMDFIWSKNQPVTVRMIYESISRKRKTAYTTVMTIMNRLVNKKLLKRIPEGKAYSYLAAYSKNKFLTKVSRQIIKNFVLNFGDTAIASFVQEIDKIPADKRQKLVKLLKNANDK